MSKKMIFVTLFLVFTFGMVSTAFAADKLDPEVQKYVAIACGFGIALAVMAGAVSQARAATAALEGIARNPAAYQKIFTPMILSLALIESLVIYALLISFFLVFKL
jgi:F-type H+-transporting ATPase subunit c